MLCKTDEARAGSRASTNCLLRNTCVRLRKSPPRHTTTLQATLPIFFVYCNPYVPSTPTLFYVRSPYLQYKDTGNSCTHRRNLPTSPPPPVVYVHYPQIWTKLSRYITLYINLPFSSSWKASRRYRIQNCLSFDFACDFSFFPRSSCHQAQLRRRETANH
jgi:hypothetical protein